ncbi:alpha/beta hydrolase [Aureobasidium pullulans]|nr:alpha/beta hydrolase [Aureobasidium pullulans]THY56689.1 alpha/beta hydrolase [Aureobasidium pullulans]THZ96723.1 alpha/beta hydrolase [Aureobasidium pullulans]
MAKTPGILYVTMQPSASLPAAEFHDWYNNEHGPNRLRLPFIHNGFRYRARDTTTSEGKGKHEWMAIYDTDDMDAFNAEPYLALRGAPIQTQRERDIRPSVDIDRRSYDLVSSRAVADFKKLEKIENYGRGNVMVSVRLSLKQGKDGKELDKWYEEEHIDMLAKVKGWLRTRRYVTAAIDNKDEVEYMALHEYAPENGLGGDEFKAAVETPWAKDIMTNLVAEKVRREYELYYTFGPAPRDLQNFALAGFRKWESPATQTRTFSTGNDGGAVESYITTSDGAELGYRLEGSTNPDAPLIVLSNSILTSYGIWDRFVESFLAKNSQYRILRYNTRGRTSKAGEKLVTMDVLASDIISLLDALKVPKAASIIGVSMGGASVLNAALTYPDRIGSFIACDTNDKNPEVNRKAWGERVAMCESENARGEENETIVGEQLAEVTVRRWFVKESYDGGDMEKECERVKQMVINNSLEGFRKSVEALCDYNFQPRMKDGKVKGVFVVGSGDGVLPKTMKDMATRYGSNGAECVEIEGAGHLPMVEKPDQVAEVLGKLVASSS